MSTVAAVDLLIQLRDEASAALGAIGGNLNNLGQQAQQTQSVWGSMFSNMANISAGIGMLQGIGGAIVGVGQSLISGSAEFEGYEARFASLMGSTDAAKAKIQELSTFASTTPFELPDVIKASQSLQVFGGAALNTKENLAIVGNAAAATGQNIGDVSFWFARAYSAIQNGQPFGEAAQNLQQMGVMSGDTVVKLNALKESGASNTEVWNQFAGSLNAPTDAMAKMGGTWTGLTSTLSDSWALLVRTFGQPLFETLKPQMQGVIDALSSGGLIDAVSSLGTAFASVLAPAIGFVADTVIPGVVAAIQFIAPAISEAISVLSQIGSIFGEMAGEALAWGANIINQLAAGIMSAAGPVIAAINSIGSVIAGLLMPGSPPAFLPALDQWGTGAMDAYLEGWGQADFGVFNSISESIKGALDGIAKASGDKGMNVAGILLGSQDEIASAVNEVRQFGKVSEETFNSLVAAIGPAGPEVSGLVSAYLDLQAATQNVASAQNELNAVTEEYAGKLAPLNAQLKGIQNQKQAIQDQKKLADLQTKLADQSLSDADRQLAMLEQQEIMTRQQIRTTEADRDASVGASKAKLDAAKQEQAAAQARVNQQKALVDAQNKTNALIAEQTKAMAGAAGAMKGAASAAAPLAEAVQGVNNVLMTGRQVVGGARDSIEAVNSSFFNVRAAIGAALTVVQPFFVGLYQVADAVGAFAIGVNSLSQTGAVLQAIFGPTIGGLITQAIGVLSNYATVWIDLGTTIMTVVSALMGGDLAGAWAALTGGIAQVVTDYQTYAANLAALLWSLATTIGQAVLTWGAALVDWIAPYIPIALGYLQAFAAQIWAWVVAQAPVLYQQVLTWGAAFVDWITPYIGLALTMLGTFAASIWTWITEQAPGFVAQLAAWGTAFIDWISPYITEALAKLGEFAGAIIGWIDEQAPGFAAQALTWGQALIDWIGPAIPPALAALGGLASSVFGWVGQQAAPLVASFVAWATALVEWIPGATVTFLAAWPGMLSNFLDWIAGAAGPLLAQLATWAAQFVAWIVPMIPGFVMALGGILLALGTFIVTSAAVIASKIIVWAGSMLGWVASNVLPALPGILGGILSSIISWIVGPANASILSSALSIGKSLVDGFVKGIVGGVGAVINAAKNLAQSAYQAAMGALQSHSPSRLFTYVGGTVPAGLDQGITAGMPKVTTNLVNGITNLAGKAATAIEAGTKAMSAAASYSGAGGTGLSGFLAGFSDMAIQFNDAAVALGGRILGTATRFADTIGKVVAPIDTALKALAGLVDFVAPARANITAFIASMYVLLNALNNMAAMFEAKAIKAAAVFAEGAGKMLGVVSPAIDALKKLPDLVVPAQSQVNAFGESLFLIVRELLNVAALFAEQSLKAGAAFGEAGAKLIAVVGPAIDALKKLPELVVPADGALAVFGDALTRTVQALIQVASLFAQDAVDAAAKFAEGAGKAIGIVGTSVDSFTKLATFTGISQAAIDAFGAGLRMVLARLLSISSLFSREAIAAAGVFGEGAGKAISALGAGIDTLGKLVTFVAPAEANVSAFFQSIADLLEKMGSWAGGFEADMLDATAVFSTGIQKSVVGIGAAVDALSKIVTFVAPAEQNVSAFFRSLADLLEKMGSWSANFEVDMLEATAAFSAGVQKSVAGIGAAVDALGKLVDFTAPAEKHVSAFFLALADLLEKMGSWAGNFEADMLASTATFAAGVSQSVAPLKGAIDSLSAFADFVPPAQKGVSAFFAALTVVLQQIQQVSALFGVDAVASAAAFATNVATVVAQLKGALQAFASLGDTTVKPAVLGAFMQAAQSLIAQMAAYLPPNAEVIGSNTIVGLINGIVGQRSNLIAAMTNTVLAAVQAAQATLGIASPSKVFEQLGQYTGMGMAGGMNAMQPAVASAGAGLGMAAVGGASGGVGGRSGGGAAGPVNITFAAGAISVNGVQGGLNDKHLKTLAGYIKEDIAGDMRGRS